MNVATMKILCWLASTGLTAGLSLYIWDFFEHKAEKQRPVDVDYVRAVLQEDPVVAQDVREGLDYETHVKPTFIGMNWTGKEAPPPVEATVSGPVDSGPTYRPISDVLWVILIQEDLENPGGSIAHVTFRDDGLERGLWVGEVLPAPNDFAVVHVIKSEGVEFSFRDLERANEVVAPAMQLADLFGGTAGPSTLYEIPEGRVGARRRPDQTERLGKNTFLLGAEDRLDFAENYAAILTNDVTLRTYYDEDGKRAGIEVQRVKPGSRASRHGALDGDIVISINGHPVASQSEAIQFVKANQDKYTVWEVKILRLGREETIVYVDEN